jgi:hypothetical protein
VEAPGTEAHRRTLTPAVLAAAVFTTLCALASISFVAANGGLRLPVAGASGPLVAVASPTATPFAGNPSAEPLVPSPSPQPTPAGSSAPLSTAHPYPPTQGPLPTPNPVTLLPRCPGYAEYEDCWLYTVRRGDTFSTVAEHWGISTYLLAWLNPEVVDESTIVVGQELRIGFDGYTRLHPCTDQPGCWLYVVRPGDRLSVIAGHLGLTTTAIVAFDPNLTDANAIYSGQTIRVPGPVACCGG